MKTINLHNGIYHCAECCIEYELSDEASLKCGECNGLLVEGLLNDTDDEAGDSDLDEDNGE